MSKKKICIVLPCYRVKNNILNVYKKLIKLKIDSLIFVDDHCPENSVKYLKSKIKKNKKVKFIFLKKNLGVGGATLKGFEKANNKGFDILLKFDSDNQHNVKDLIKIIKILVSNDVYFCKGYRDLSFKSSIYGNMPLIRVIGTNALTFISRIITGNFYLKDVTNGLFGMKSKLFKNLNLNEIKKNYFFEQDLIFQVSLRKFKIYQVNSKVMYENETSSLKIIRIIIPFLIYHFQNFCRKYL